MITKEAALNARLAGYMAGYMEKTAEPKKKGFMNTSLKNTVNNVGQGVGQFVDDVSNATPNDLIRHGTNTVNQIGTLASGGKQGVQANANLITDLWKATGVYPKEYQAPADPWANASVKARQARQNAYLKKQRAARVDKELNNVFADIDAQDPSKTTYKAPTQTHETQHAKNMPDTLKRFREYFKNNAIQPSAAGPFDPWDVYRPAPKPPVAQAEPKYKQSPNYNNLTPEQKQRISDMARQRQYEAFKNRANRRGIMSPSRAYPSPL